MGFSWKFIHNILSTLFDKEYSKFFVEAGGYDGEFYSNTLWLEQHRNWTGLLVEPQPQSFQNIIYKRRKCWISNACLSMKPYPKSAVMAYMETQQNYSNLDANIVHGSAYEILKNPENHPIDHLKSILNIKHFTSQCFPLYSFLLALNHQTIDFLSLDLEGTEIHVFLTIPLDKIYIRTVVLENYGTNFDSSLVRFMNKRGFKILDVGGSPDYFFVNEKETILIEKYRRNHQYFQEYIDNKVDISMNYSPGGG